MKVAVESTGGLVVLSESFGHSVFKDSFKRLFEEGEHSLGLCFKYVFLIFKNEIMFVMSGVLPFLNLLFLLCYFLKTSIKLRLVQQHIRCMSFYNLSCFR